MKKLIVLAAFLSFFSKVSMASTDSDEDIVPFDVGRAGATASVDIHVSWLTRKLSRIVYLMINIPQISNDGNGNDTIPQINQLVESLTGRIFLPYPGNIPPKPHKGIKLHVIWIEKKTGNVIQERDVITGTSYHGAGRIGTSYWINFSIDGIPLSPGELSPGDYVVTVKALNDDSRFNGVFKTDLRVDLLWK